MINQIWLIPITLDKKVGLKVNKVEDTSYVSLIKIDQPELERKEDAIYDELLKFEIPQVDDLFLIKEDVRNEDTLVSIYIAKLPEASEYDEEMSEDGDFIVWMSLNELEKIADSFDCDLSVMLALHFLKSEIPNLSEIED